MEEIRICSKCGGNGPFPSKGHVCRACKVITTQEWRKKNPEKVRSEYNAERQSRYDSERMPSGYTRGSEKTLRYKAKHPDRYKAAYSRKKQQNKEKQA